MSNTLKRLLFLGIVSFFLFCIACAPIKRARVAAVALTAEDVAKAAAKQSDPTIVRSGSPAYLMLVDGLIDVYPENRDLLAAGCRGPAGARSPDAEEANESPASTLRDIAELLPGAHPFLRKYMRRLASELP